MPPIVVHCNKFPAQLDFFHAKKEKAPQCLRGLVSQAE
jgi:hypothetical protein